VFSCAATCCWSASTVEIRFWQAARPVTVVPPDGAAGALVGVLDGEVDPAADPAPDGAVDPDLAVGVAD